MIDFRYHLVSIMAVFLALAIGIVLGSTALRDPVIQTVQQVADDLRATNGELREQVTSLRQKVEADQKLVKQVGPDVVEGQLEGERIIIVAAPGASGDLRAKTVRMVEEAGATVTGRVAVRPKYLDKGEAGVVGGLASRLKPSGMKLPQGSPYERAAAVLADALMAGSGASSEQSSDQSATEVVLSGFKSAGYIAPEGDPGGDATLAVMIAPEAPYEGQGAAADNAVLVDLAAALDQQGGGALVAGAIAATRQGGLIHALRGSGRAAQAVSSVDFAATATGRVGVVFALASEDQGKNGHYGLGGQAGAYLPPITPTQSAELTDSTETSKPRQSPPPAKGADSAQSSRKAGQ